MWPSAFLSSVLVSGESSAIDTTKSMEPPVISIEELYNEGRMVSIISCEGTMISQLAETERLVGKTMATLMACYRAYDDHAVLKTA